MALAAVCWPFLSNGCWWRDCYLSGQLHSDLLSSLAALVTVQSSGRLQSSFCQMWPHRVCPNLRWHHKRLLPYLLLSWMIFLVVIVLLSHHLCWPPALLVPASYLRPHPRLNPHYGPAPRGPQEEMSYHWWAAVWRRHCTAAESLWWCSVVPVLIEHMQDMTYYAPYWQQC